MKSNTPASRRPLLLLAVGLLGSALLVSSCQLVGLDGSDAAEQPAAAAVDAERLLGAESEPANWMSHGRTYSEQRFSPLDAINAENVDQLGLAWSFDLETERGVRIDREFSTQQDLCVRVENFDEIQLVCGFKRLRHIAHYWMVAVDVYFELSNGRVIKEESSECLVMRHFDHTTSPAITVDWFGLPSASAVQS